MLGSRVSNPRRDRRGMVAVQVALCLTALMGVLALLVDGGLLVSERRHAQATADAAALAAASDIYYNNGSTTTASASALSVAAKNGYTNDGTTSQVTVNIPPQSGNFTNSTKYPGCAEVIVTWYQKRGFSAIFGSGTIPVSARAVAQGASVIGGSASPAILLLSSGNNITDNGTPSSVTVTPSSGGAIYLDGDSVTMHGAGSSVTAPYVYTDMSSLPSGVTGTLGTYTSQPQLPDPLSYLPEPPTASNSGVTVNTTYQSSGITGSVTLNSNTIYIVGGNGIDLSGQHSVTGTNVMIYLTGSSAGITLRGRSSLNLSPLSTGPYAGISIFQDRSDSTGWTASGNGTLNATGTIYAPAAQVIASGNGGNVGSQIIASSMTMNGNGNAVAYSQSAGQIAATRVLGLVE